MTEMLVLPLQRHGSDGSINIPLGRFDSSGHKFFQCFNLNLLPNPLIVAINSSFATEVP